jgi:hypothetical protein
MTIVASHISSLYKALPVYLWVEDEETRTYLETVWQDGVIGILVAGGLNNVDAAVKSARGDGLDHVFGLRDRDFGASNRPRWNEPAVHVFAADAFEVESYFLDANAMAGCVVNSSGKTSVEIEAEILRVAGTLGWWMSCRRTIAGIRDRVAAGFIEHPPRANIQSLNDGVQSIVTSAWWTGVLPGIPSLTPANVDSEMRAHHGAYQASLAAGTWRDGVSAKEVFVELLPYVYTRRRPANPEGRLDFVKAIGERQRDYHTVPADIADLRSVLRARVGL